MKKIILDTDIGTDVDDSIALMYCLNNPEIDLLAVTTVHGNSVLRAKIAQRLIGERGIPVAAGIDSPLVKREIYWMGHEGKGILDGSEKEPGQNGVDLLYQSIRKNKDASLVCIGPLTNIAALLQDMPEIKDKIREIYFMGDVVEQNGVFVPNYEKHNIKVDPEAADIVFGSGIELKVVTTRLSKSMYFAKEDFEKLRARNAPQAEYLYQNAIQYMAARKQGVCYLYDPLTVLSIACPSLVEFEKRRHIAVSRAADAQKCKGNILETIAGKVLLTGRNSLGFVGGEEQ